MGPIPLTERNPLRWPRYVFFRLTQWQSARGADMPVLNAFSLVAVLLCINLFVLAVFASTVLDSGALISSVMDSGDFRTRRLVGMVLVFVFLGALYLRWILADQYKRFFAEYGAESDANRRAGSALVGAYIFGSVLLYGLTFVI